VDKLLQYTDLLHRFEDPDAKDVRDFIHKYADDEAFTRRAKKLNALFLLKAASEPADTAVSGGTAVA
jgi:hypothetical protein